MSELETLIAKHLDGELSPSELVELRGLLASSPDAIEMFREMTSIRRAARRAAAMRRPAAESESRLFQALGNEGLRDAPRVPSVAAERAMPARRRIIGAAVSLALVALVAIGTMLVQFGDTSQSTGIAVTTPQRTVPSVASPTPIPKEPALAAITESSPELTGSRAVARRTRTEESAMVLGDRNRASQPSANSTAITSSASAPSVDTDTVASGSTSVTPVEGSDSRAMPDADATSSDAPPYAAYFDSTASLDMRRADSPELLPMPGDGSERSIVSAAVRYGTSVIDGTPSERAQDFSVGLELAVADGQRLTLLAGRSAAVTEQRAFNTHAVPARTAIAGGKDEGASLQKVDETPDPYDLDVSKEWWLGIGYNVDLYSQDRTEISFGARGGVGARSLRVGLEMPVRLNVSDRLAVELAMSGAYVVPHNSARSEFSVESASDGYLYDAETEHTAFGTYGVSIGLRLALD